MCSMLVFYHNNRLSVFSIFPDDHFTLNLYLNASLWTLNTLSNLFHNSDDEPSIWFYDIASLAAAEEII